MRILAVDQSTSHASMSVLQDDTVVASDEWEQTRRVGPSVVSLLPGLLRRAKITATEIDIYAVGIGPGIFSSLRVSVSAAVGMALPGGKPVVGIGSAEAIAWDLWKETGQTRVAIVGDARRERLWFVQFELQGGRPEVTRPYQLIAIADVSQTLRGSAVTASPDWDRIEPVLAAAAASGVSIVRGIHLPRAETIGRLARLRAGQALPATGSTPSPIYVHPPVFVEARFPKQSNV